MLRGVGMIVNDVLDDLFFDGFFFCRRFCRDVASRLSEHPFEVGLLGTARINDAKRV